MGDSLSVEGHVDAASEPASPTEMNVDEDSAVFELSPASAEQVTQQIRTMVERTWEYIAIAYQGRAYAALGYRSWDEYVDDRLGDLRLTVPRRGTSPCGGRFDECADVAAGDREGPRGWSGHDPPRSVGRNWRERFGCGRCRSK